MNDEQMRAYAKQAMTHEMTWNFSGIPAQPGWHAALVCYDVEEGTFPLAAYWDGTRWLQKAVVGFGDRCDTKEAAQALAYEHDPDK